MVSYLMSLKKKEEDVLVCLALPREVISFLYLNGKENVRQYVWQHFYALRIFVLANPILQRVDTGSTVFFIAGLAGCLCRRARQNAP